MGAGGKRPVLPIVGYDKGVRMGLRTTGEWAELLNVQKKSVYNAKSKGYAILKRYTFGDATDEEIQSWREARSISVMAKTAREQGKSYGQLVAERWMTEHAETSEKAAESPESEEKEEAMEECVEAAKPAEIAGETEKAVPLSAFAAMAYDTNLEVYRDNEWLVSAPCDSPIFQALDWTVDCFQNECDSKDLKVWVKGEQHG